VSEEISAITVVQSDDGTAMPVVSRPQTMDVEREFASKELLDLLDKVQIDITPWIPETVGESLYGVVFDIVWVDNKERTGFDPYWMVVVQTPSGRMLGFHGYHTVVAKNLALKKESGELSKGAQIAISYRGEGEAKGGKNPAKMYNMALIPVQ